MWPKVPPKATQMHRLWSSILAMLVSECISDTRVMWTCCLVGPWGHQTQADAIYHAHVCGQAAVKVWFDVHDSCYPSEALEQLMLNSMGSCWAGLVPHFSWGSWSCALLNSKGKLTLCTPERWFHLTTSMGEWTLKAKALERWLCPSP